MPVKDRLPELEKELKSQGNGTISDADTGVNHLDNIYKRVELISRLISDVAENTQVCEEILQGKKVQRPKEQQDLLRKTFKLSETTSLKISTELKQMKLDLKKQSSKGAESRLKQIQYAGLVERFKNTIQAHQDCVQKYGDARRELLEKSAKIVENQNLESCELQELMGQNEAQMFTQDYLLQEREARQQLTDVENRHKELLAIESHLLQIRDLFVQMAILIEQQQESINRIEFIAMEATEYVDNTVVQLGEAEVKQKGVRKKWVYLGIIIAIVLVIFIIAVRI